MGDGVALLMLGAAVPVTLVLHLLWQRRPAPHHWYADSSDHAPRWADRVGEAVARGSVEQAIPADPVRISPPEGMKPSEVGFLVTGRPRHRDQTAALLDLIGKGGLDFAARDGRTVVTAGTPTERLTGPEQRLVANVRRRPHGISVTAMEYELAADLEHLSEAVVLDRSSRWWMKRERPPWLVVLPGVLMASSTITSRWWGLGVLIAIVVTLLRPALPGRSTTGRTEDATSLAVQCLGWARHLGDLGGAAGSDHFEDVFWTHAAWIVALGLEERWRAVVPDGVALCTALMNDGPAVREPMVTVELVRCNAPVMP